MFKTNLTFSQNRLLYILSNTVVIKYDIVTVNNLLNYASVRKRHLCYNREHFNEHDSFNVSDNVDSYKRLVHDKTQSPVESPKNSKILKAAIIGPPNAGKSTLINQIIGRQVFAISSKVHTTRCRARGVYVQGKTQLVFLDTPGLVSGQESRKHNLEQSFLMDGEMSIQEADIVGLVHDVYCDRYNNRLDPKVLRLLHFYPDKHTFLVINKIDNIKSKRTLLDLAETLTCQKLNNSKHTQKIKDEIKDWKPKTEFSVNKSIKKEKGWPHFKEIFMVSALEGNGVGDIKEYLLMNAKPGEWLFSKDVFTDQTYIKIIEETVQAKLLDNLPNEVPYNLSTQLEYYEKGQGGGITAVVLVGCKTPRIEKLVMGSGGWRIKAIAKASEDDLRNFYRAPVRLRIVVTHERKRAVDIDELIKSGSLDVLQQS